MTHTRGPSSNRATRLPRGTRSFRNASLRGFTLIELLLVLVILGALAAIVVPKFTRTSLKARITTAKTGISHLGVSLNSFEISCGRFPTSEEGLLALLEQPANVTGWEGPYIEEKGLPVDPWGNPYIYRCPGRQRSDYDLFSVGPDGQEGTDDDIVNWAQK